MVRIVTVVMVTLVMVTLVMETLVMVIVMLVKMVIVVVVLLTVKQALLVVTLSHKWSHRCGHSDSREQSSDPSPVSSHVAISIQHTST